MHTPKKTVTQKTEKREDNFFTPKIDEGTMIRCVNCNKPIAQGEVEMGRIVLKCRHCGVRNGLDHQTAETGTGRWLS